jgi:thiol-disulfide isomerase/thioredoxin
MRYKLLTFHQLILWGFLSLALLSTPVFGMGHLPQETDMVDIYFFWGEGCPYCEIAKPKLSDIASQNPRVNYYQFEIYNDAQNRELFFDFCDVYGIDPQAVPTTFVADRQWVGFSDSILAEINQTIENCLESPCPAPGREVLLLRGDLETGLTETKPRTLLTLPLIGEIDLNRALIMVGGVLGLAGLIIVVDRVLMRKK